MNCLSSSLNPFCSVSCVPPGSRSVLTVSTLSSRPAPTGGLWATEYHVTVSAWSWGAGWVPHSVTVSIDYGVNTHHEATRSCLPCRVMHWNPWDYTQPQLRHILSSDGNLHGEFHSSLFLSHFREYPLWYTDVTGTMSIFSWTSRTKCNRWWSTLFVGASVLPECFHPC